MKFYGLINYYSNAVTTKDEEVREGGGGLPTQIFCLQMYKSKRLTTKNLKQLGDRGVDETAFIKGRLR